MKNKYSILCDKIIERYPLSIDILNFCGTYTDNLYKIVTGKKKPTRKIFFGAYIRQKAPNYTHFVITQKKIIKIKVDINKLKPSYIDSSLIETVKEIPSFKIGCTVEQAQSKEYLIDYIASNEVYKRYAKSIVKKIASNKMHQNNNACLQIVKEGFKSAIFEDIQQEIFISLMALVNEGKCFIDDSYLIAFTMVKVNEGKENEHLQSSFIELYRTIGRTLQKYSNIDTHYIKKEVDGQIVRIPISIVNYDAIATMEDKEGNTLEYMISSGNPAYTKSLVYDGCINDLLKNDSFISLMKFIKKEVSASRYNTLLKVLNSMLKGQTIEQCSKDNELSIDKVKKARQELKTLYKKALVKGIEIDILKHENKTEGIKEGINYTSESLGYTFTGKYIRNWKDKPIYKDVRKVYSGGRGISGNYNTSYNPVYIGNSYKPSIGAITLMGMDDNKDKNFNASNSGFEVKEGKKVFNVNKDKGIIEVWNYIAENGYIYSKELLRTYPIVKG